MKTSRILLIVILAAAGAAVAQQKPYPKAKVSYDDFKDLVAEVESHRASRLIDLDRFLEMSKREGVVVLDTRSTNRYDRVHVKGAKHLAFTDFTQDNLRAVIPSPETTILIYCNNNFEGNPTDFATKMYVPLRDVVLTAQLRAQRKPRMLALNVPTYINLYGYGYRNVFELDELVDVKDPRIELEGTEVGKDAARPTGS